MLDPVRPAAVAVHAGAVPLPGRIEIRDLDDAAQVAGAVRVAASAVPEVLPERRGVVPAVAGVVRHELGEPIPLPATVDALKDQVIAADQSQQVTEQRRRRPLRRGLAAVSADDRGQGAQVRPLANTGPVITQPSPAQATPAAAARTSAERRIAERAVARAPWQVSGRSRDRARARPASRASVCSWRLAY